ncbi:hypothetical protein TwortDSMZ_196 [Staphylococcus phage Twort]|uniref:Uncharacterized protein n=2 Tax=Staphylococcus phage Twort (strain DSM 17442 / HER 48) TaxID=2908167 RepID=A0A6H0X520_BPTWO|nr:ORF114 [Staphylococcus phage Twort]AAX92406.1 ORF114 [Staphylococcus phage Twort]QIW89020.1 hypothetical protein TwortDSMZ_007 [Staphylococcus phage Twort]QIW89191.1 hypothetical protein TwortDSMZ_196 [Staphylococcus phage Twort]
MEVFDLKKFVVDNGLHIQEGSMSYYEYKVDSSYSIRVVSRLAYCDVIVFVYKSKYIHSINTTYEEDKVEELEKLLEESKNISVVMDYYLIKRMERKRIEAEEQRKLDKFMLKGE